VYFPHFRSRYLASFIHRRKIDRYPLLLVLAEEDDGEGEEEEEDDA